jgi:hypothetical protein
MGLRLYTNQLPIRILGTLTGIGFLAVGAYAIFGADDTIAEAVRERAFWFGFTALIGGVWAVAVSWLDSDLSGVWCRPPRQPRDLRARR